MLTGNGERNEQLETIIELIEGMLQEEGYKTLVMSKGDKLGTTSYDGLILRDANGQEYTITFDLSRTPRKRSNGELNFSRWESTNYLESEVAE